MHVENDTVDVYIGKKVREPRWKEIVSFDVFFLFFFWVVQTVRWQKRNNLLLPFSMPKWYIIMKVFKRRFTFIQKTLFSAFMENNFCCLYIWFLAWHQSTTYCILSWCMFPCISRFAINYNNQNEFVISNSIFKYEIRLRWLPKISQCS